jgi:hypothetical protein
MSESRGEQVGNWNAEYWNGGIVEDELNVERRMLEARNCEVATFHYSSFPSFQSE